MLWLFLLQGAYIFGDQFAMTFDPPMLFMANRQTGEVQKIGATVADGLGSSLKGTQLWSWSVDNAKELYYLSTGGIYRVVDGHRCKADC